MTEINVLGKAGELVTRTGPAVINTARKENMVVTDRKDAPETVPDTPINKLILMKPVGTILLNWAAKGYCWFLRRLQNSTDSAVFTMQSGICFTRNAVLSLVIFLFHSYRFCQIFRFTHETNIMSSWAEVVSRSRLSRYVEPCWMDLPTFDWTS